MRNAADRPPKDPDENSVRAAISDASQRSVLSHAIGRDRSAREIERDGGLSQATTYRAIHALTKAGLLVRTRSALTRDGKRYDLYRSRLVRLGARVDAEGLHVDWETDPEVDSMVQRRQESEQAADS